MTLLHKKKSQR